MTQPGYLLTKQFKQFLVFIMSLFVLQDTYGQQLDMENLNQAMVFRSDSSFWLHSDIRRDHRFFGYEKPDTSSVKLILFSVFTPDVEGNPYQCPLGAYYETAPVPGRLRFVLSTGRFLKIRLEYKDEPGRFAFFYVERKWVEFK